MNFWNYICGFRIVSAGYGFACHSLYIERESDNCLCVAMRLRRNYIGDCGWDGMGFVYFDGMRFFHYSFILCVSSMLCCGDGGLRGAELNRILV